MACGKITSIPAVDWQACLLSKATLFQALDMAEIAFRSLVLHTHETTISLVPGGNISGGLDCTSGGLDFLADLLVLAILS